MNLQQYRNKWLPYLNLASISKTKLKEYNSDVENVKRHLPNWSNHIKTN